MNGQIAASQRTYEPEPLVHCHDHWQLVFPGSGRLELTVRGERGVVTGSRLAVVSAGFEHTCWASHGADCLVVDLASDLMAPIPEETVFRSLDVRLSLVRQAVLNELCSGGLTEPLIADGLARYLAGVLANDRSTPGRAMSASGRRIATLAREAIDAGYRDPLSIAALAVEVGASPSHLQRSFKLEHGVGIVRYLLDRRLTFAAALLRETDLPVTHIALDAGFESASYFTRRFTESNGLSPSRYRTQYRAELDKSLMQS